MGRHGSRGRFTILGLTLTLLLAASPALGVVQLEIEEWHEQGWLEAASSVTLWTDLAPGEERLFTRRLETRPAENGTVFVLRRTEDEEGPGMTARPPGYGLSEKFPSAVAPGTVNAARTRRATGASAA